MDWLKPVLPRQQSGAHVPTSMLTIVLTLLYSLVAAQAQAEPRELRVQLNSGVQMDRNARLAEDNEDWEAGGRWGLIAELSKFSETGFSEAGLSEAGLIEQLRIEATGVSYADASDLNEDRLGASYLHVWAAERRNTTLRLALVDRDAQTSELSFDRGEIVRDDDQRRRERSGVFDNQWQLSENLSFGVNVSGQRTEFHGGTVRTQADFDFTIGSAELRYDLDEYSRASIALTADRFESALSTTRRREDTVGLNLEYARSLSEATSVRLSAGYRQTEARSQFEFFGLRFAQRDERGGVLGEFELAQTWSGGDASLTLRRSRLPSGVGAQFDQDEAALFARLPVDENRGVSVYAAFNRNRSDVEQIPDQQLWSVRTAFDWQMSEALQVSASLGYRGQSVSGSGQFDADGAVVQLSLQYQLDPVAL